MLKETETTLPRGTQLQEYRIESVLGVGGFGITYLAIDVHLEKQVVIKEFLPNDIAVRKGSDTVVPKSHSDQENYEWGMSRFILEAKTLAKFNHPNIVRINRFFEANNTAYFVMDYEEGEDLQETINRNKKQFSEEEIYNIIMPILDGLKEVHSHKFLHRDIKPGNIFLRRNGSPMLIDFGASRFAMGAKSKSLSVVLTEGYAPKEQYSSTSKQEAYTDLYSIGAVMYKMATGETPPEASARADAITDDEPDPYKRLQDQKIAYGDNFKKAVDWTLEFKPKDRPQSVKELQDVLMASENKIVINQEGTFNNKSSSINKTKDITKDNTVQNDLPLSKIIILSLIIGFGGLLSDVILGIITMLPHTIESILNWGFKTGLMNYFIGLGFLIGLQSILNITKKQAFKMALYIGFGCFFGDLISDVIYFLLDELGLRPLFYWGIGAAFESYFVGIGVLFALKDVYKINSKKSIFKLSLFIAFFPFLGDIIIKLLSLIFSNSYMYHSGIRYAINNSFFVLGFLNAIKKIKNLSIKYIFIVAGIFTVTSFLIKVIFEMGILGFLSIPNFSFGRAVAYYFLGFASLIAIKIYQKTLIK